VLSSQALATDHAARNSSVAKGWQGNGTKLEQLSAIISKGAQQTRHLK